jgi:hypothetical protein
MCLHHFKPVTDQKGRYNSAAHESLRAVIRCLIANFGKDEARTRANSAIRAMGVTYTSELSECGANWTRKFLEKQLPIRGDYC